MGNVIDRVRLFKEASYNKIKEDLDRLNIKYDVLTTLDEYLLEDTHFNKPLFLTEHGMIYYNDIGGVYARPQY